MNSETTGTQNVIDSGKTAAVSGDKPKLRIDKHIWGVYIALIVISLIELYSASSREVTAGHIMTPLFRHAALLGLGCLIMIGLQRVNYVVIKNLTWAIVIVCFLAAIYTMFFGQVINGARRSFSLGFISIQSSELLKFASALLIAYEIGDGNKIVRGRAIVTDRSVIIVASAVLIFGAVLIKQGLTNTLLLMAISLSLMLIGGVSSKQFFAVVGVYLILGGGYWTYSHFKSDDNVEVELVNGRPQEYDRTDMRGKRMDYYFTPDKYNLPITSQNQQSQYSFIAQANGGVFGVGLGKSRETARLPLAFSDYIYAIIVEDSGLIGGLVVILLYLMLLARAGRVGTQCQKVYPTLLIIGMAIFIVYQALFHMAIVTGVFPVSGQPLPFISKGGSSVIISSVALGIMLSVSRYAARKNESAAVDERGMANNPLVQQEKK